MNIGKLIAESITNHPDEWVHRGNYAIRHAPSGFEYWVGNGWSDFDRHNCTAPRVPFWQRYRAYKAYKKWAYAAYSKQMNGSKPLSKTTRGVE